MNEIWRDIHFIQNGVEYDYRDEYQISNYGRVKSLKHGKEKIKKIGKNAKGYSQIGLLKNGQRKMFKIHRLVAHMFLTGYFEGAEVNHIDENKNNNHVLNLEWCTREYNENYGTRSERIGKTMKEKPVHNSKLVSRYDLEMNLIDIKYIFEYENMGFCRESVSRCCRGTRKSHKGYIFRYWNDDND